MRTLLLVLICASPSIAQESGSSQAARTLAGIENRAIDQEIAWNAATKLTNDPTQRTFPYPQSGTDPGSMKTGDKVELAYWNFKVLEVIDNSNLLISLGTKTVLWVEQCPTKDLATDQPVRIVDRCTVTGTKTYETAAGTSRTVKVIRMPTADELKKEREAEEAAAKEKARQEEEAKFHVWHSKAGTEVTAKLVGWKASKVELETKEGKRIFVELNAFTAEDGIKLRKMIQEIKSATSPKTKADSKKSGK